MKILSYMSQKRRGKHNKSFHCFSKKNGKDEKHQIIYSFLCLEHLEKEKEGTKSMGSHTNNSSKCEKKGRGKFI